MLDHQIDQLAVAELVFRQSQLFENRLTLTQEVSWLELHLANQFSELLPAQRLDVVVHFVKRNATLTEQLVHLATLRSSGLFVNCDRVWHFCYGKIPLTLVASTTLPTARM